MFRDADESGAVLSDDGMYRYSLNRSWGEGPLICWIMLNPSTADALQDDPTIRRCIRFSERLGFGALVVVNLFALRSPDPQALRLAADPVGPDNDHAIRLAAGSAACCVAAWGTKGGYLQRDSEVLRLVTGDCMADLFALDMTKDGHPKHPLYVKGGTIPRLYARTTALAQPAHAAPARAGSGRPG